MSEKPLLLSGAKSGILVHTSISPLWRIGVIVLGIIVIGVGAADAMARLSHAAFGDNANFVSFAPAIAVIDPSLFGGDTEATTTPLTPTRLEIPSIGVRANVEHVGKKTDGSMDTPKNFVDVAWYSPGSMPGQMGNAVIAGHVNNALGLPGVFENLIDVKLNDVIRVSDTNGRSLSYAVRKINTYNAKDAPTAEIFSTDGPSRVVLITCDGIWDGKVHSYDKRLVVVAELLR